MSRYWIVAGAGRCGLQLARSMRASGVHLTGIVARSPKTRRTADHLLPGVAVVPPGESLPAADGLLIAVPDSAITTLAGELAGAGGCAVPVVLHTSGAMSGAELAPLAAAGVSVGSFHPLVSFASATGPLVPLAGVTAVVEGEPTALAAGVNLARQLGMTPRRVDAGSKPRYHAAAAVAANLTHILVRLAREELEAIGFSPGEARRALAPLVESASEAAIAAADWRSLTGPLARGDAATVSRHLEALPDDVAAAYRAVCSVALARLAAAAVLDEHAAERLVSALTPKS